MDPAIIFLIIAVILIVAAIIWIYFFKYPEHTTMLYERELKAEGDYHSRMLAAAKIITFQGVGYLTTGVSKQGKIEYERIVITAESIAGKTIYDADEIAAHNDAVQLVSDSIDQNGKDNKKMLTADEWQARGHRRDDWQAAVTLMNSAGITQSRKGGSDPGVFTLKRDLNECMLALAIRGRPPRPKIVDNPIAVGAGNKGI